MNALSDQDMLEMRGWCEMIGVCDDGQNIHEVYSSFRASTGRSVIKECAESCIASSVMFGEVPMNNKYVLKKAESSHGYLVISTSLWTADRQPIMCHFGSMNYGVSVEKVDETWITTMRSEQVVIKQIDRSKLDDYATARSVLQMPSECPYRAAAILQYLQRISVDNEENGVVKLLDCFEDDTYLYLVFPYCQGGNLKPLIPPRAKLNDIRSQAKREARVRVIAEQLLKILDRLHQRGIYHNDVALDNIVLSNQDIGPGFISQRTSCVDHDESLIPLIRQDEICLIDFGAAFILCPQSRRKRINPRVTGWPRNCGKLCYLPPECHDNNASFDPAKRDVFAVGVSCLLLLSGFAPCFKTCTQDDLLYKCVTDGRLAALLRRESGRYSPLMIDFLEKLLTPSVEDRPEAHTALTHELFSGTTTPFSHQTHILPFEPHRNELGNRSISIRSDRSDRYHPQVDDEDLDRANLNNRLSSSSITSRGRPPSTLFSNLQHNTLASSTTGGGAASTNTATTTTRPSPVVTSPSLFSSTTRGL